MAKMQGSAYLPNDRTNRSGLIVVVAAVGVCWSLTVLVTRLTASLSRRRGLGREDWGIVASTTFCIASSIAIFGAVKDGFGRRLTPQEAGTELASAKALYAADILYILALAFSKLATVQLILGLSPVRRHKQTCYALSAFTALWTVASVLVLAIRCDAAAPWTDLTARQCGTLFPRWAAIESISLVIECCIWVIAAAMVRILQMPGKQKFNAMLAFSVRLPVIIPTILRLYYLNNAIHSSDYNFDATKAIIAMQCVMHYATMSASFSYLKPFLAAFDSNMGASNRLDTIVATRSSDRRKVTGAQSGNWPLGSHTTSNAPQGSSGVGEHHKKRSNSEDSKAPIIMKTTTYRVDVDA